MVTTRGEEAERRRRGGGERRRREGRLLSKEGSRKKRKTVNSVQGIARSTVMLSGDGCRVGGSLQHDQKRGSYTNLGEAKKNIWKWVMKGKK